jgi:ferrous iron transport protein B
VVALVGNPNTGKTTLFNRLTGLRARTANFPGTTLERRVGSLILGGRRVEMEDLPGLYALSTGSEEERVARDALLGNAGRPRPSAVLLVVDQTNLARNLYLASQVRELGLPLLVALNMSDIAGAEGLRVDAPSLSAELGAPVVAVSARTGEGMAALRHTLERLLDAGQSPLALPARLAACAACSGCAAGSASARFDWAEDAAARASAGSPAVSARHTARIDRVLTHPVAGLLAFALVMCGLFVALFGLAELPMKAIESAVAQLAAGLARWLPPGDLGRFVVDGALAGVGGVLVFLPQICLLFFLLSLLEDSGYLARAAFVVDRLMSRVGLPGKAFVPMLSAHACAVPALMSARVIGDRRDRLVTILVVPLLTCSARLPVYAMVIALLFAGQPLLGGVVLAGAYGLGIAAALAMAWLFKRTLLRGESRPLVLELPTYKLPSLRTAALAAADRGAVFLRKAGTVILVLSTGMWALSTHPKLPDDRPLDAAPAKAAAQRLEYAMAGRIGKLVEPVFEPLGFDWRIDIGVLSSFAARETLVSTLSVVFAAGQEASDGDRASLRDTLRAQTRPDGTRLFGVPTACSLLVFFALAMQCLATLAVTRRESGSWRIALLQFTYMTALAYTAALVTYQSLRYLGT